MQKILVSLLSNDGFECELLNPTVTNLIDAFTGGASWTKMVAVLWNTTTPCDYIPGFTSQWKTCHHMLKFIKYSIPKCKVKQLTKY